MEEVEAGEGKGMAVAEEAAEGEVEPPVGEVAPADEVGNKGKVLADEPKAEDNTQQCRPSVEGVIALTFSDSVLLFLLWNLNSGLDCSSFTIGPRLSGGVLPMWMAWMIGRAPPDTSYQVRLHTRS